MMIKTGEAVDLPNTTHIEYNASMNLLQNEALGHDAESSDEC